MKMHQFQNSVALTWVIAVFISGLLLPLLLFPIIALVGYSEIIEEIAKACVVFFLVFKLPHTRHKISAGILFGFLFGLSESVFYLANIVPAGDFSIFWQRMIWTVPMHMTTVLIIVFSGMKDRTYVLVGTVVATIVHLLYNSVV